MKKLFYYIILIISSISIISCESRDYSGNIVGKYEFSETTTISLLGETETTTTNGTFYVTRIGFNQVEIIGDWNGTAYTYSDNILSLDSEYFEETTTDGVKIQYEFHYTNGKYTTSSLSWETSGYITGKYGSNIIEGTSKSKLIAIKTN